MALVLPSSSRNSFRIWPTMKFCFTSLPPPWSRCFPTKARWKNTCRGYPYVFSLRLEGKTFGARYIFFHFFLGWKKPTYSGHQMVFSLSLFLSSKKIKMVAAKYCYTRVKWKYTWWPPYVFFTMFFWGFNIILLCFITR